jgi:outer membrane lipoprotein SlyB
MNKRLHVVAVLSAVTLGGCAVIPAGPSVLVLPGSGKSFDQFQADNAICRQYADLQVGGRSATQAAQESATQSAVLGTVLGAAVGAAAGQGRGAAIGAASGLALGSAMGAGPAYASASELQRRYDYAYVQCMYAKGNRVPVGGELSGERVSPRYAPPPSSEEGRYYGTPPPPPPGAVPPPRYVVPQD